MKAVRTGFDPRRHAPPFPNYFPRGTPVVAVPTPFGRLALGDAAGGLCGGMVFTALDCFLHGVEPPREPTPAAVRYFARRLLTSWDFPFGVLKYYDWQRRSQAGLTRLTTGVEWPKVQRSLDAGMPVPLGMVKAASFDPRHLPRNHQVLAHGYTLDADGTVALMVYDPNHPDDADTTLTLPLHDPESPRAFAHSAEGRTVRGLFVTAYTRPDDAPRF